MENKQMEQKVDEQQSEEEEVIDMPMIEEDSD